MPKPVSPRSLIPEYFVSDASKHFASLHREPIRQQSGGRSGCTGRWWQQEDGDTVHDGEHDPRTGPGQQGGTASHRKIFLNDAAGESEAIQSEPCVLYLHYINIYINKGEEQRQLQSSKETTKSLNLHVALFPPHLDSSSDDSSLEHRIIRSRHQFFDVYYCLF